MKFNNNGEMISVWSSYYCELTDCVFVQLSDANGEKVKNAYFISIHRLDVNLYLDHLVEFIF